MKLKQTLSNAAAMLAVTFGMVAPSAAAPVARFWLENTITRQTYGPILNQPGYRFQIETDGFVVLAAQEGQVLFSTYPETQYLGPFDLQPERIVDLGAKAYAIVRLDSVEVPTIPPDVLPPARIPPPPKQSGAAATKPETIPVEPWAPAAPGAYPSVSLWIEPYRSTKYDWHLGQHEGKRASDLDQARAGGTFTWGGLEGSLGFTLEGEHADSVMPATSNVVTSLKLKSGSGFYAAAGYQYNIPLDKNWYAYVGGLFEYRNESYDLTARVYDGLKDEVVETIGPEPAGDGSEDNGESDNPAETVVRIPQYRNVSKSVDLRDMALSVKSGVVFEDDAWGARIELLICAWDDTTVDGGVEILGEPLDLKGSRSHPISVSAAAWCYVLEGVWTEAKASFGGETALRFSVGYDW